MARAAANARRVAKLVALFALPVIVAFGCSTADVETYPLQEDDPALEALIDAKADFADAVDANPDLPAWYQQRAEIAFALGDRQFEAPFDRVFDSTTVALASLGCRVNSMERASGYVAATIPQLPPARLQTLTKDAAREQAAAKGFPAAVIDRSDSVNDIAINASTMMTYGAGMTLSVVRQSQSTTKVKLRFDKVYYPMLVDEYYGVVWQAIDKQLFLDNPLATSFENR